MVHCGQRRRGFAFVGTLSARRGNASIGATSRGDLLEGQVACRNAGNYPTTVKMNQRQPPRYFQALLL